MSDVKNYIFSLSWNHFDEKHMDDEVAACNREFGDAMREIRRYLYYYKGVTKKDICIQMSRYTFDRIKKLVAFNPTINITIQSDLVGNDKINGFDISLNNYDNDNHCKFYIKDKPYFTEHAFEKINRFDIASVYPSRAFREEYCGIFGRKENKNMTKEELRMVALIDNIKNNSYEVAENCIKDYMNENHNMEIKEVIYHDPATIILWKDRTKTVVKCQKGDIYDPEKGFIMAFIKKFYGNKGNFNDILRKWVPEEVIHDRKSVSKQSSKRTRKHK